MILERPTFLKRLQQPVSSTALPQDYSCTSRTNCITLYVIHRMKKQSQERSRCLPALQKHFPCHFPSGRGDYFYAHLYLLKAYVE